MRRILVAVVVVIGLLGFAQPDADAHHRHAANGRYAAIDVVDGSNLRVKIRPHRTVFRDDGGTVCADAGLGFVRARHRGRTVVVDAATVSVTADLECRTRHGWVAVLPGLTLSYTYDDATGVLTDSTGQTYTRR